MQLVRIEVTGATQFVNSIAITGFNEQVSPLRFGPNTVPRILGYAYNSQGVAHTVALHLSPAVGADADAQIALQTPTGTVNNFTQWCGTGGPLVPKLYGVASSGTQAPTAALGSSNFTTPFVLLFSTTDKAADGTFYVWYDFVTIGGTI